MVYNERLGILFTRIEIPNTDPRNRGVAVHVNIASRIQLIIPNPTKLLELFIHDMKKREVFLFSFI